MPVKMLEINLENQNQDPDQALVLCRFSSRFTASFKASLQRATTFPSPFQKTSRSPLGLNCRRLSHLNPVAGLEMAMADTSHDRDASSPFTIGIVLASIVRFPSAQLSKPQDCDALRQPLLAPIVRRAGIPNRRFEPKGDVLLLASADTRNLDDEDAPRINFPQVGTSGNGKGWALRFWRFAPYNSLTDNDG